MMVEKGFGNNILMIQSNLRSKVKECMPAEKDVALDLSKEIIRFQTDAIGSKQDYLKTIFANMDKTQESVQLIPMLLALILNDVVFEKFGYEEEDFMKNVGEKGTFASRLSHHDQPRARANIQIDGTGHH